MFLFSTTPEKRGIERIKPNALPVADVSSDRAVISTLVAITLHHERQ
jgi:hypothetical protein